MSQTPEAKSKLVFYFNTALFDGYLKKTLREFPASIGSFQINMITPYDLKGIGKGITDPIYNDIRNRLSFLENYPIHFTGARSVVVELAFSRINGSVLSSQGKPLVISCCRFRRKQQYPNTRNIANNAIRTSLPSTTHLLYGLMFGAILTQKCNLYKFNTHKIATILYLNNTYIILIFLIVQIIY